MFKTYMYICSQQVLQHKWTPHFTQNTVKQEYNAVSEIRDSTQYEVQFVYFNTGLSDAILKVHTTDYTKQYQKCQHMIHNGHTGHTRTVFDFLKTI